MVMMTETLIDGDPDRYEQRYSICIGRICFPAVRRPVVITPPDGWVGGVDDGLRNGTIRHRTGAAFVGGKWKGVRWEPTHWTDFLWEQGI